MTETEKTIEQEAIDMGWAPKESFRGDPERWIDAETYVTRGRELMPILKANSRKQAEELAEVRVQLQKTTGLLQAATESIEALKEFNTEVTLKAAKEKGKELKAALVEAKKEDDVEREVELEEQLREHNDAIKAATKAPTNKAPNGKATPEGDDYTQNPEWKAWTGENEWFGKDRRKTALALGIADELKANPETKHLVGRGLLDKVSEEIEIMFGTRQPTQKVEGGGPSGGGGKGKGYGDLPADAKEACERQVNRLVGDGRAFKTAQEWRNHYATQYHAAE